MTKCARCCTITERVFNRICIQGIDYIAEKWPQIEKELYAIVFGSERFHQYVYGRTIQVETDHKPLEVIFKKPLVIAPMRIQKLMLRLQKYNINRGSISDFLSRTYLYKFDNSCEKEVDPKAHVFVKQVSVSKSKMDEFRRETTVTIRMAREVRNKRQHQLYWDYRREIHEAQGLVFKKNQ